jgi:hypothetical protein
MHVIVQKRASASRGGGFGPPWKISANRGLAHVYAELEQLAVDAGRAPKRVCPAHLADQFTDLAAHPGTALGNVIADASRGGSLNDATGRRLPV